MQGGTGKINGRSLAAYVNVMTPFKTPFTFLFYQLTPILYHLDSVSSHPQINHPQHQSYALIARPEKLPTPTGSVPIAATVHRLESLYLFHALSMKCSRRLHPELLRSMPMRYFCMAGHFIRVVWSATASRQHIYRPVRTKQARN